VNDSDDQERREKRRWLAVLLASIMMLASYLMFIWALAAASGDEAVFAGGLFGIALGLVPGAFAVAAFVSHNPKALSSTLLATLIWLVVAIPIGIGDVPSGLVAGFGAGGVVAFRLPPGRRRRSRVIAVVIAVVYAVALQRLLPEVGLFAAAPLPFLAIALADLYDERFAEA
jgi:hypothetical protein